MSKNEFSANWFLEDRHVILITETITSAMAASIIMQLEYCHDAGVVPELWICSPGGEVDAGMAIHNTMRNLPFVKTVAIGNCSSMAALLLAAGTKGKRCAYSTVDIMIHQPLGGCQGQASDMERQWEHMKSTKRRLNTLLAKYSGQSVKKIEHDTDRDYYMTAEKALEYGIIDEIIHLE